MSPLWEAIAQATLDAAGLDEDQLKEAADRAFKGVAHLSVCEKISMVGGLGLYVLAEPDGEEHYYLARVEEPDIFKLLPLPLL